MSKSPKDGTFDRSELFRRLGAAANEGAPGLMRAYVDDFRAILDLNHDLMMRRGRLRSTARGTELIDQVKASAILNDLSFLDLQRSKKLHMTWLAPAGHARVLGEGPVSVAVSVEQYERIEGKGLSLAFSIDGDEPPATYVELAPLIENGYIVVQPSRMVMYVESTDVDGSRTFNALEIDESAGPAMGSIVRTEVRNVARHRCHWPRAAIG